MSPRTVGRPSRSVRHAFVALVAAAFVGAVGLPVLSAATPASAEMSDDAAQRAAREIQAARDRANAAAEAFLQAQSDLEVLQDDAADLEQEAAVLRERVEQLQRDVASLAVARFATSGSKGIPLLTGLQAPKDQIQAEVYGNVVTNAGNSSIDEFELARKELAAKQQELRQREDDIENQQKVFAQLQDEADAEVKRLREIEEQRLTDEAVVRALAAQQEAALAKLADAELRTAEAAARALPNPGVLAAVAAAAAAEESAERRRGIE